MIQLVVPNDWSATLGADYVPGSGFLDLAAGQGAALLAVLAEAALPPPGDNSPLVFKAMPDGATTRPQWTLFWATGLVGDQLQGVVAVEGRPDQVFPAGTPVTGEVTAGLLAALFGAIATVAGDPTVVRTTTNYPNPDFVETLDAGKLANLIDPARIPALPYQPIGSYQPADPDLADIAAIAPTKGRMLVGDGAHWQPLSIGTDGQVITTDPTQATGLKWTTIAGSGAYTFYASANGCALNANLTSGGGTDDTAALQALLDKANTLGRVRVIVDGPALIGTTLYLWSNTELVFTPGAGLFMASGIGNTGAAAIRNKHPVSSYNGGSPVYDFSTVVDHDITIRGGYINGNKDGGASGSADKRGNAAGNYVFGIAMFGVKNLVIEDVEGFNIPTYFLHLSNVQHVTGRNIKGTDPLAVSRPAVPNGKNTDLVHVTGPGDDLKFFGITGSSCDDLIALNARDGNLSADSPYESGQAVYINYATVYKGPITNVEVVGVHSPMSVEILRWVSDGTARVDGIKVSKVTGNCWYQAANGIAFGTADYGTVELADWQVSLTSDATTNYMNVQGNQEVLRISGHVQKVNAGQRPGSISITGSTFKQIIVEDCVVEQLVAGNEVPLINVPDGPAIKFLKVAGCTYRRDAALAAADFASHLLMSGANGITDMVFANNAGLNVRRMIDVPSTLGMPNLTMSGTHHTGANAGDGTVRIGNGMTLAGPVSGATRSAKLYETVGTGAVTGKRTDGTELT